MECIFLNKHCGKLGHSEDRCWAKHPDLKNSAPFKTARVNSVSSSSDIPNKEKVIKDAHNLVKSAQNNKSIKKWHVADRSYLTNYSSTVPFQNDWEGHDQDEVFTGRRVATTTVKSGAPKTPLIRLGSQSFGWPNQDGVERSKWEGFGPEPQLL